eukprot:TRINITY_DN36287_c0_g1_i1.p1 TRINITY_DN36287_c0_g1~~TRINITY_DN36287_c0_g1_i1.p1  ORF type:complete len:412 (-),score=48.23 TRINITY_DN36287_c0_g1_i1:680-1915(-)
MQRCRSTSRALPLLRAGFAELGDKFVPSPLRGFRAPCNLSRSDAHHSSTLPSLASLAPVDAPEKSLKRERIQTEESSSSAFSLPSLTPIRRLTASRHTPPLDVHGAPLCSSANLPSSTSPSLLEKDDLISSSHASNSRSNTLSKISSWRLNSVNYHSSRHPSLPLANGHPGNQPGNDAASPAFMLPNTNENMNNNHSLCGPAGISRWHVARAGRVPLVSGGAEGQRRTLFGCVDGEEDGGLARQHEEHRVIGYTPTQLFDVVAGVDLYQDFVPWCRHSEVIWQKENEMDAELEIGFRLFHERYVSHVKLVRPTLVKTTVSQSLLFDYLDNTWEFRPGPDPHSTALHFGVAFQFRSALYRGVANMFFDEVVSRLVGAFEGRCRQVYGPSKAVKAPSPAGQRQPARPIPARQG